MWSSQKKTKNKDKKKKTNTELRDSLWNLEFLLELEYKGCYGIMMKNIVISETKAEIITECLT